MASLQVDVDMALSELSKKGLIVRTQTGFSREFSFALAQELAKRIGGRYVPKMMEREDRAKRDAEIVKAFQASRDHQSITRQFGISRRLLYTILARSR